MRSSRLSYHHLVVVLVLLAALALPVRAHAASSDPTAFMNDIGTRVLKIINDKAPETRRKDDFRKLVEESFDIPRIAQFVLGRYWRTATDDEKKQFVAAFENYMVQIYWSRFTSYNGETFSVGDSQDQGNGQLLVTTEIMRPASGQPPVKVAWSLTKQGDSLKIRDASLEGISQALTYREEFSSIIERNGGRISALIEQLNERAKG